MDDAVPFNCQQSSGVVGVADAAVGDVLDMITAHRIRMRLAEPKPSAVPSALEETKALMNDPGMGRQFRRTGEMGFLRKAHTQDHSLLYNKTPQSMSPVGAK